MNVVPSLRCPQLCSFPPQGLFHKIWLRKSLQTSFCSLCPQMCTFFISFLTWRFLLFTFTCNVYFFMSHTSFGMKDSKPSTSSSKYLPRPPPASLPCWE